MVTAIMGLSTGAAQAKTFAISCAGSSEITFNGPPKSKSRVSEARTFVINDDEKTVAFYNEIIGAAVPLCMKNATSCSYDFYPNEVSLTSAGPGRNSVAMIVDRAVGSIWLLQYSDEGHREFKGGCKPTAMPAPDTKYNAF